MNQPPEDSIRVPHKQLRDFVVTAATTVGLPDDKASLLADLLSRNDLRGIFSHGTQQIATYALLMRDGKLNNQPDVTLVQETASSVLVDGDGGLGYFPPMRAPGGSSTRPRRLASPSWRRATTATSGPLACMRVCLWSTTC
jgi:hypothetical protein